MGYSLDMSKLITKGHLWITKGTTMGVIQADTRSLDYGSYNP